MEYLLAFLVGGVLCIIGQLLIDMTKLTPARILVIYVTVGVLLTAVGLYGPPGGFRWGGATVPLTGFGYALATGVQEGVQQHGLIGALSGGITATAAGIAAAVFFGFIVALVSRSHDKS